MSASEGAALTVEDDDPNGTTQNHPANYNYISQQSHAELIQDLTEDTVVILDNGLWADKQVQEQPMECNLPGNVTDAAPDTEFQEISIVEQKKQDFTGNDVNVRRRSMVKIERQDHDYSGCIVTSSISPLSNIPKGNERAKSKNKNAATTVSLLESPQPKTPSSPKEISISRVKNINQLKKVTPKVKLISPEVTNLSQLTKINVSSPETSNRESGLELSRNKLENYCRTCAGLKVPLVDIFGEKGMQMRLNQQIKHLEDIQREDSLSTQMCMDCICDLKMSYKFFMQIKKAQVKLQSINTSLQATMTTPVKSSDDERSKNSQSITPEIVKPQISPLSPSPAPKEARVESPLTVPEVKIEPEAEFTFQLSDNESLEEFDPEDPEEPLQLDNSETAESESERVEENSPSLENHSEELHEVDSPKIVSESFPVEINERPKVANPRQNKDVNRDANKTVYQYDTTLKAYVKVENPGEEKKNLTSPSPIKAKLPEATDYGPNNDTAPSKQPNILKRKVPMRKDFLGHPVASGSVSETTFARAGHWDTKKPKLNVENAVSVTKENEEGIMYVTVKGTKPNELLLVKVKKMDKSGESKKTDKSGESKKTDKSGENKKLDKSGESKKIDKSVEGKKDEKKKPICVTPVDQILKKIREEPLATRDKDYSAMRSKALDIREQIIANQIEEYKKKREKVLGGSAGLPNALKFEDGMIRFVNPIESVEPNETVVKVEPSEPPEEIRRVVSSTNEKESQSEKEDASKEALDEKSERAKSPVFYNTTGEYLSRLAKLKRKWEEAKKKKESLQRELAESYTEGNLEKLGRILGEKEKNLREFQDYLKQRKIVITRLKDEDIISLYEDRNSGATTKSLPDLIDATTPTDYIAEENYLECDYCPKTFGLCDLLEEHLKTHDYKLVYYCEDCQEEFPTVKAKRSHNASCIKKLICKYCDVMLDSKGKKRQHEQKHVDSIYGQLCEVCGEKFKHQGTLDQHFKTQHMTWEKIHDCPKCPKKFAFKQKLTFHLKSVHTSLRAYLCEDCGADFKNPASLRHHRIRKHHPTGNKRECPVCTKLVPFYSLSKHMYTHKAYTIQCPHCDKMFKNSSTLKQHVRIHEDQRQYRCDTCGVGFNRRDGLRLHMRVHQKSDSRALKECSCQICSEKFPNHSMLVIHRNRVHKDGRQYTCHICNRSMLSPRSLEWHMSHIHNETIPDGGLGATGGEGTIKDEADSAPEKKRVACVHCDKTFKTEMILRTHIKNTHMEKDPTKCLDCELTFTSDVRLRHHMMVAHNRLEGTLPCPHCSKRFVNQLRLKTHMISHSEDRPYTCEICGFNLKTKIQLIKHHQNRHSDERPLQCRYCPWRCKQVSALVCHERTHTNERPYSCIVCRQRFKYLGDKNKHERRHESLGGSGFKRIVAGRNLKQPKTLNLQEDTSTSEQDQVDYENQEDEDQFTEEQEQKYQDDEQQQDIVKFEESDEMAQQYEQSYEQEYEETSREASEAAEVIMSMEDTTVYTEEVTADNIDTAEIITDEIITDQILQSGTVVHLQQHDDTGKIQVIPVMLSLPDLSDSSAEVNLATASIMYNN